jgi:hypothetical protein
MLDSKKKEPLFHPGFGGLNYYDIWGVGSRFVGLYVVTFGRTWPAHGVPIVYLLLEGLPGYR